MSDAKKCDRCGKFYDAYEPINDASGFRFINSWNGALQGIYDLCPDCMEELTKWLTNPKEEKNV